MKTALLCYIIAGLLFCASITKAQLTPSDPKATKETNALLNSMQKLVQSGIMFGHHDDTAYGVGWRFNPDSSDVKAVTGSYPAVYGWDFAKMEHDSIGDINRIPFKLQKQLVKEAYQRGGINTFCWHMDNPSNGKSAWDTTSNSVKTILADGDAHNAYVEYLDRVAKYAKSLKGDDGEHIPILFRPFHELTGSWFWWGAKETTPEDFIAIWRFTIDYLRKKKVHNMLVVYSVADFNSREEYLARYPGDDYVDVIGFDIYCNKSVPAYAAKLDKQLIIQQQVAEEHHKLASLAETGYQGIPDASWWTGTLLPEISKYKLSYLLAWRNAGMEQYFVPYPGQVSEADFMKFSNSPNIIFQTKLTPLNIYGKKLTPAKSSSRK